MIREILKPKSEVVNIRVPKEYIGKEIEVIVFSKLDIQNSFIDKRVSLAEEFKKLMEKTPKMKDISYKLKMEDEINNFDIL